MATPLPATQPDIPSVRSDPSTGRRTRLVSLARSTGPLNAAPPRLGKTGLPGEWMFQGERAFTLLALWIAVALLATACGGARAPASPTPAAAPETLAAAVPASQPAGSPGRPIHFERLTLEDGLSQSSIRCIVQDARGFMWFGTEDGLNRYDGYAFKVYRHDPENPYSLSNNDIQGCERDQRGVVWIVTRDGTLHRYEPESERFVRYTLALEDPLQQQGSEFTALHGDAQGRLWIGTFGDGLVRYDPEEDSFTTYRPDPADPTSLSHRVVWRIYEDREGTIWVGTEGGLNRYDAERDRFVRYPYRDFPPDGYQYDPPVHRDDPAFQPDNPHALASPAVTWIHEDRAGRLWVGTRYGGLNRLDLESGRFTSYPYDPAREPADPNTFSGNSVHALLEDRQGDLWVSSAHWNTDGTRTYARLGLERLDPETGGVTRYRADPEEPCSLAHDYVVSMYEDRQGTLWFHTFAGGVEVYDRATGCFVHHAHDPDDERTLSADDVTRFYEDEAGGLWIGTTMGGISHYDPGWTKFPVYRIGVPGGERQSNNSIWRIAPLPEGVDAAGHANALWVSTFAGLNHWDRRSNAFTFYEIDPQLPDVLAYAIWHDAERQTLWLGTTMGLERAQLPAGDATAPPALDFVRVLTRTSSAVGIVTDMVPAEGDALWLARYRVGLSRFDRRANEIVATYRHDPDDERSLGDDRLMDIVPGAGGTLWLLTESGIEHFDPAAETFTHYLYDDGDPQSVAQQVFALYQDAGGEVWLGTDGHGLQRLDPATGRVTAVYQTEQGLPNDVVYSILPDEDGGLWLSTNLGLARFDPEAETFQCYTSQDGLQSNEFNLGAHYVAADGELFLGGVNGINAFYPHEIAPQPYVPPVVLTEIQVGAPGRHETGAPPGGATLQRGLTEPLELSYRDRILSFEFAALHYALPERNQYAYMMEGFDREWNHVGNRRFATYTNLPPGRYTFRVKGSNSDGVWNERGVSLPVIVTPPFWATWWFRGAAGLLLVGGVLAGYRLRVRGIEARSRELERQVAERTEELAAVNAIAAVVSRSLDLDEILADALDKTLEVMGIEAGGIYLLDESTGLLAVAAHKGFSPQFVAAIDGLAVGEGFSGRVVQSGQPLVVQDVSADPALTRIAVREEGLRSLAVVPLRSKGRILGTLFAVTRGYREFTARGVQLLTSIGRQIGVAVENARLFEAEQRRAEQFRVIGEVGRRITSILAIDELLEQIVRLIQTAFNYDIVEIGLIKGDDLIFEARSEPESAGPLQIFCLKVGGQGVTAWVAATGEPLLVPDVSQDPRYVQMSDIVSRSELAVPIQTKEQVIGVLNVQSRQLGAFDRSDLAVLQSLADQAAIAIENARLFDAEQRRVEQFCVIGEVGRRITSILAVDELLNQMARLIHQAFHYYHVGIGLLEGDEVIYRVGAGDLWDDPGFQFEPIRLEVGAEGITGWVAATGEPLLVADVSEEPRYVWMQGSRTRSELTMPIRLKGQVIGVLDVQSDRLNAFDGSDLAVLQSLADQAAIAIENARLYEQARQLAVMEERQRLARELHDAVTQTLFSGSLIAEALPAIWESDEEEGRQLLQELRQLSRGALAEMRTLLMELRPAALVEANLGDLLRQLGEAVAGRTGLPVTVSVEGSSALPDDVHVALYRIAQEALNNVVKHAQAGQVTILLRSSSTAGAELCVSDDGRGFEVSDVEPGELGLGIMHERAQAIGASLTITSQPGHGTQVRAVWKG